jgi:hypothetical protein
LFFAGPLLLGLALVLVWVVWGGKQDAPIENQLVFWGFLLMPYVLIGTMAALASRSSTKAGWLACLGGFTAVLACYAVGYLGYRDSIEARAGTGAALTAMLFICAAIPGSLVGSAIGWATGQALSRPRKLLPRKHR